jgi:hypothetical protein
VLDRKNATCTRFDSGLFWNILYNGRRSRAALKPDATGGKALLAGAAGKRLSGKVEIMPNARTSGNVGSRIGSGGDRTRDSAIDGRRSAGSSFQAQRYGRLFGEVCARSPPARQRNFPDFAASLGIDAGDLAATGTASIPEAALAGQPGFALLT